MSLHSQLTAVLATVFGYLEYCHGNLVATACGLFFFSWVDLRTGIVGLKVKLYLPF